MELEGKVAVVTGASRGIGRAIAIELGRAGAHVIVNYLNSAAAAAEVLALIGRGSLLRADVTTQEGVDALIAAGEAAGGTDILVNNAGITRDGLMLRMTDEQWSEVLDANLTSTFRCSRAVAQHMLSRRRGVIINLTSVSGLMGNAGQANYASSNGREGAC